MYWTYSEAEFPDPTWNREAAVADMPPFDPDTSVAYTEPLKAYCRFYGLDLDVERPGVVYRLGYLAAARFRVALHFFSQPESRGTVFIFHGYLDHSGLYTRLIDHCLDENLNVVIYDQPGHGLSSGKPTAINSFRDYQRVLERVLYYFETRTVEPWLAIGQSTGGGVLIDHLISNGCTNDSSRFRGVTLLAPLIRPTGFRRGKLMHTVARPFLTQWHRVFAENSNDTDFVRFLKEHDPLQARAMAMEWLNALRQWIVRIESAPPVDYELTVIQGEADKTVEWRHNLQVIRRKFSRVWVYQIPEGRHHLVNESEAILDQVFDAISESIRRTLNTSNNGKEAKIHE